jgi:hypothetical protein
LQVKGAKTYFFDKSLGKGYNAAVISYKLPFSIPTAMLENSLKVKLLDFNDLLDRKQLDQFFIKFLESNGL